MFTPEFVVEEKGEFVLVANHFIEHIDALNVSIRYNKARIAFGKTHLPGHLQRCVLIYDIRGQNVPDTVINQLKDAFDGICELRIKP